MSLYWEVCYLSKRLDHGDAYGDVWDEVAVHHVYVYEVSPALLSLLDLLPKSCEVC